MSRKKRKRATPASPAGEQQTPPPQSSPQSQNAMPQPPRRSFLVAALAVGAGATAVLTPLAVGVAAFLSPLFRKRQSPMVRLALLDQVPENGQPRSFPVVAPCVDAWNRCPDRRLGAVYLIRQDGQAKPLALSAKCPHAGCFVGYESGDNQFNCPCHTSSFKLDGSRVRGDDEVSPRDMDQLPVELREVALPDGETATEVWVEFIEYQTGHKQQIPTA